MLGLLQRGLRLCALDGVPGLELGDDGLVARRQLEDGGSRGAEGGHFLAREDVVRFPRLCLLEDARDAPVRGH